MANPWFAFYGSDYDRDTSHLTMLQDGAYFRLLRAYYSTGGPLPVNSENLVRICGAHSSEEIEAISFILSTFFSLKSDGWHQKRCDIEIKEARRISKIRRLARLNKRKSIVPTNDNHLQTQSQSQSHIQKEESKPKAASAFVLPDWLSKEAWGNFEEMRRKIRKPMTDRARALILSKLFRLRQEGGDAIAILDQSIRNSWQDVYEVRGENGKIGGNNQAQPRTNAAIERYHNNKARIEQELGVVVGETNGNGTGHEARLGAGSPPLLEGRTK